MQLDLQGTAKYTEVQSMAESIGNFVTYDVIKDIRGDVQEKASFSEITIIQEEFK